MGSTNIRLIIFDLDGVLVDSRYMHYQTFADALRQIKGIELSWKEHEQIYDGLSTKRKLALMVEKGLISKSEVGPLFDLKQRLTQESLVKYIVPNPRIRKLLESCKSRGLRLACASNAVRWSLEESLRLVGIYDLFELILSNEDVIQQKPSPEIYLKVMSTLGVSPENTLILEDSPHGRKAAYESGAHVLEIADPQDTTEEKLFGYLDSGPGRKQTIHVVVPMAGLGSRFTVANYTMPKPFIDVLGKPMIFWVIDNMRKGIDGTKIDLRFHFIMRAEHRNRYGFEEQLARMGINATFHETSATTAGAACSVLLAAAEIDNDQPLVIINSDQYLEININEFYRSLLNPAYDGIISTFYQPDRSDLKWSYAALDPNGIVTEVKEKVWIGPNATTGLYGWRCGSDFVRYANQMIAKNIRTNGEFYVCPVYNEAIADKYKIRTQICKGMWGLGVPEDLEAFIGNFKDVPLTVTTHHNNA